MLGFRFVAAFGLMFLPLVACEDPGPPAEQLCEAGSLTGARWLDLGAVPGASSALSILIHGDEVLVGTEVGLFRRPLDGSGAWTPAGLEGLSVRVLRANPADPRHLVAGLGTPNFAALEGPPVRVSFDGGASWSAAGEEFFEPIGQLYDPIEDLVFTEDGSELYANSSVDSVVRSRDGGKTWAFVRGAPGGFGYPCHLQVADGAIYQGCEVVLDDATITRSTLTAEGLGAPKLLAGRDVLQNRRPNSMTRSPFHPGVVWAGLEGGLVRIEGEALRFVHRDEEGTGDDQAYMYVEGLWVDPCDEQHLVYAGAVNADRTAFPMFETFDGGKTRTRLTPPAGLTSDSWWIDRVDTDAVDGRTAAFAAMLDFGAPSQRAHVFVRIHDR